MQQAFHIRPQARNAVRGDPGEDGRDVANTSGTIPLWIRTKAGAAPSPESCSYESCPCCGPDISETNAGAPRRLYRSEDTLIESRPIRSLRRLAAGTWMPREERGRDGPIEAAPTHAGGGGRRGDETAAAPSSVVVKWVAPREGVNYALVREAFAYGLIDGDPRFCALAGVTHGRPRSARRTLPESGGGRRRGPGRRPLIGLALEEANGDLLHYIRCPAFRRGIDVRAGGPLPAERLLVELLLAVAALHRVGIFHRDIKPANVLLLLPPRPAVGATPSYPDIRAAAPENGGPDRTGGSGAGAWRDVRIVLGDLGASAPARLAATARVTNGVCTAVYAPPEDVGGGGCRAPSFDVYCVAAVVWHYLLVPGDPTERIERYAFREGGGGHGEGEGRCVSGALRDLLHRMIAADPRARPTVREALAHPALAGFSVAVAAPEDCPPPSGPSVWRARPRKDADTAAVADALPAVRRSNFSKLAGWMAEACEHWRYSPLTHASAVLLLLDFLRSDICRRGSAYPALGDLQRIGCACLLLAAKLIETEVATPGRHAWLADGAFAKRELVRTERAIFVTVGGRVPVVGSREESRSLAREPWWRIIDYWQRSDNWAR